MADILDARKYKLSKIFTKDLDLILQYINLSIKGLERYKQYLPAQKILYVLKEEKLFCELQLKKYEKIKKDKGKINE